MDIELFVQNVKFFCAQKNVKPTIACRESGAGKSFIDQMERRGSIPSVEKVQQLAQYLGVTVSELLGETGARAESGIPEWLDKYLRLSPETQKEIAAFVEFKAAMEPVRKTAKTDAG